MIEIIDYDSNWISIYKNEEKIIRDIEKNNLIEIHHIGSTAIPNIKAKPKVDILLVVKSFDDLNISKFENQKYKYRGEIIKSGRYFAKQKPHVHLHVFEKNNPKIDEFLNFRDFLINNEKEKKEYENLKIYLSKIHPNKGMDYANAKNDFVKKILKKIKEEKF
ncbi:MAG: hypothetical protein K1060chlam5_01183 [Candidatus Anoxychlamydiales bacterium]|nr:hypothetical protein [Candidatus Anoxychlamydiales bacterium]